jgi:hypothetical protein
MVKDNILSKTNYNISLNKRIEFYKPEIKFARIKTDRKTLEQFYYNYQNISPEIKNNIDINKLLKNQQLQLIHPISYQMLEKNNKYITWRFITLTSSPKDIYIHGEKIKVTQIGTYFKNGKEVPQYAPEASCVITTTEEDFNLIIKKIENIEELGLNEEKVSNISKKLEE